MTAGKNWNPKDMFQAILDRCPVGIAVIDYDGIYLTVNPAYCAIYGYEQQDMLTRSFTMVFPEADRQSVLSRHRQFLDEGGKLGGEWTVTRRDGSILCVWSESVRFVERAGLSSRLVYVLDITERRKAQEQMQIAATVYETSHEAILVTDADNNIIAVNPAFSRLTGYEFAEVAGQNPRIFKSDRQDDAFFRDMWRALNEESVWVGEIWDRRKNGEDYLKELTITVVRDRSGAVLSYVGMFSDITLRKKNEDIIWRQANFDAVTGLPNRHMFKDRLEQGGRKALREGRIMALMLIDLDHFKEVNDSLGHRAGDALLAEVSLRISGCLRAADTVARLGGDEFAVILSDLSHARDGERVAQTLLESLAKPFLIERESVFVSASIGIAVFPDDSDSLDDLFKNADQAMYAAKGAGRNCFSYFTPAMQQAALDRMRMSGDLRRAINSSQFEVYYQPIVHLLSGRVVKAEALVRWNHPTRGIVGPAEFIPLAEDTGLILPLGDWVARQAIAQLPRWRKDFDPEFQITVNQSPAQFRSNDFTDGGWVQELERYGLDGKAVVIEITEGLLLNAEPRVNKNLLMFRDAGVQIAIDDFGTGYSSLSYLRRFDIDYLKIDRSFVEDLDGIGLDLCEAIVVMAHRLGLEVVAEGVETTRQRDILARIGCDYAQGYLFSRPLPPDPFSALLRAWPNSPLPSG